jgi:transposase
MHWPERIWAVEDCRHVSGRLERDLLAAGERVVRVPPRLMAGARQAVRVQGKSDPIDALAVARAALGEPDLPTAGHDQASWEIKLLVDHREHLVAERTRTINRLRWHLHQLDPDLEHATRRLPGPGLGRITTRLAQAATDAGCVVQSGSARPKSAPSRPSPTRSASWTGNSANASPSRPIAAQPARLRAADRGQAHRRDRWRGPIPLRACFAMHAGVAPIPISSDRHRLSRGGNRQLNAALHRVAITQLRLPGPGQSYYQRRRAQGDGAGEAVRALKRRIARTVYQRLRAALPPADIVHTTAA